MLLVSSSCPDTAGTYLSLLLGFRTAQTPGTLSSWVISVLVVCGLPYLSQYVGRQYSNTLSTPMTNRSRYLLYLYDRCFALSDKKLILLQEHICMCWMLLSRAQTIMSQLGPQAAFST